jgi:N-glycosylase/DNA lyase
MKNKIALKNVKNFSISQIAESGQTFRWDKNDDDSYTIVALGKVINISQNNEDITIEGINEFEYEKTFKNYFDMNRDYSRIIADLKGKDKYLDEALIYGSGIRILNQDVWETIISFIISGNNNIPRIKKSINKISEKYGNFIKEIDGKNIFSFPTPKELSVATVAELRECGVGYRDKYIYETTKMIVNNEINLELTKDMEIDIARNELKKLLGVGNKVADCILLFSLNVSNAFPVDTWVKKILSDYYGVNEKNNKKINEFANNYFGKSCGIAQQYLFYYVRKK